MNPDSLRLLVTPEQASALIVALTGLVAALGVIIVQLRQTHNLVNSRMTQLVDTTKLAAHKDGELAGRDFYTRLTGAIPTAEGQISVPTELLPPSNPGTGSPGSPAS